MVSFQAAHPAGVGAIVLLLHLVAGEDGLAGVDDDDVVAAVGVGGIGGLALPRSRSATMTAVLPMGLPAASTTYHLRTILPLFCHKSGHGVFPPV